MATTGQQVAEETVKCDKKLRGRFKCFRVLILGRANAGKTTILQKVCNTDEQPVIFDGEGREIDTTVVMPSVNRGIHDIENEMVFKSNPGFIFHDSRGFEAGGDSELHVVKDFVAGRARRKKLRDQLHAIWYCIPVDNPRPVTAAENSFFSECGTGKVPVVAVFTKMDALDSKAWNELVGQNMSREEAKQRAPEQSLSIVKSQYMSELLAMRYPPKGNVYMRDMNKESTECRQLIEETVSVLDDSNLQLMLVSTQQVSIEICVKYSSRTLMNRIFERSSIKARIGKDTAPIMMTGDQMDILKWFPHFLYYEGLLGEEEDPGGGGGPLYLEPSFISSEKIQSCLHSLIRGQPVEQRIACLGIALIIITEHSFFLWDRERSKNPGYFTTAMNLYKDSTMFTNVVRAVNEAFKEDQRVSFRWLRTKAREAAREALSDRLLKIAMDNRLPKDSLSEQVNIARLANEEEWTD